MNHRDLPDPRRASVEATDQELIEARERMDAGLRLALPMLFDEPPAEPKKPLDPELARVVGSDLAEARDLLIGAMKLLDANRDQVCVGPAHVEVGKAVSAIDDVAPLLAGTI